MRHLLSHSRLNVEGRVNRDQSGPVVFVVDRSVLLKVPLVLDYTKSSAQEPSVTQIPLHLDN